MAFKFKAVKVSRKQVQTFGGEISERAGGLLLSTVAGVISIDGLRAPVEVLSFGKYEKPGMKILAAGVLGVVAVAGVVALGVIALVSLAALRKLLLNQLFRVRS